MDNVQNCDDNNTAATSSSSTSSSNNNTVALACERTIPTELPQLVGEVSANFYF
jgi:hypothetical protein